MVVWFVPTPIFNQNCKATAFKQIELTRTHFGSILKRVAATLLIMFV